MQEEKEEKQEEEEIFKIIKQHVPTRRLKSREISNFGRIRDTTNKDIVNIHLGSATGRNLNYRSCKISYKTFGVHRLVYENFVGKIADGLEIDHIDDNPSNNRYDNLQLLTHSANCKKRILNKQKKGVCIIAKDKRNKKYRFLYHINEVRYSKGFYTEAESKQAQKDYIVKIKSGEIF